ncbi:MAG: response regulator, partial [bacterium]
MKNIRIFLIEDNRILREGIQAILNGQHDMKVVAASGGIHNMSLEMQRAKPNILLLDLGLRSQNGLRVVSSIAKEVPEVKVIGMGLIP